MRPPGPPPRSHKKGIWALCLALFGGACCCVPTVIGALMASAELRRSEEDGDSGGRILAVAALAIAAGQVGSLVLGIVVFFGFGAFSLDSGGLNGRPANADVNLVAAHELVLRDCFDDPSLRGERGPLRRVPCTERHDGEVLGVLSLGNGSYPGARAIRERGRECRDLFRSYVEQNGSTPGLAPYYYYPRRGQWPDPATREITCALASSQGPLAGRSD